MSLTDAQKASVRTYLGYSDLSRTSPSKYNLEGALMALSAEAITQVQGLLTQLATIETSYNTVTGDSQAGIIRVEDIQWGSPMASQAVLAANGTRLVRRLAVILGVPVIVDPFSSSTASAGIAGLA